MDDKPPDEGTIETTAVGAPSKSAAGSSWIRKPLSLTVGFLLGIAGSLVAAEIFHIFVEQRQRELSFYVNPAKSTIVRNGQSSDLQVFYRGQHLSTDVTAVQIEIWNAGKESIRPEQVLAPITLSTSPRVPILEAKVRHTNRSVTEVRLDDAAMKDGTVGVSWKILERDDGATIQLIVAGPNSTHIDISGVVEGQTKIKMLASDDSSMGITARIILGFLIVILAYALSEKIGERALNQYGDNWKARIAPTVIFGVGVGILLVFELVEIGSKVPLSFD